MKLTLREKIAYGLGAVGKDMVYMVSATYILYYYQDILGVSAAAMGLILLVARVFDAFNDPLMGVIVSKTKTRWGKFRPWLLVGTIANAVILVLMFSAPPALTGGGLVAYAAVTYILWGVTYTMMDIPFWSMIPAFTKSGKDREGLSAFARSCAGVGSALITVVTVMAVSALGHMFGGTEENYELLGYSRWALVIAAVFVVFILITCIFIKEKSTVDMESASVKDMFKALLKNDQAMVMVISIVAVNTALYITSNLVIYFFKYDFSPKAWEANYTLFNTAGGAFQILAMMAMFPLMRKFMDTVKIFYTCFIMAFAGYAVLLLISFTNTSNVYFLLIPAFLIMSAIGVINVIVTIFLANTVDYGQVKNNRRDEAVIFSMQTFVVKLASGVSAFVAGLVLQIFSISKDQTAVATTISDSSRMGLRMSMTIIPIVILVAALIIFKKKYILTEEKMKEITEKITVS